LEHWLKIDDETDSTEPDFCLKSRLLTPLLPVVAPHSKFGVTVTLEQKKNTSDTDQFEAIDYSNRLNVIQNQLTS